MNVDYAMLRVLTMAYKTVHKTNRCDVNEDDRKLTHGYVQVATESPAG